MRHREVIRQWNLLRTLDACRQGATVPELARDLKVTTRTIWRDMEALQEVGFPLISERDGKQTRWQITKAPFRGLADLGISMVELCSLYMSRAMIGALAGAPFANAMAAVCSKIEKTLPPKMRAFLDQLPAIVEAKPGTVKKPGSKAYEDHLGKLIEASADRRVCAMRYHSASSGRAKDYIVHPYRLVHADGGMYFLAWVPAYKEIRTFAIERIQKLSLQEARFEIETPLASEAFANSLGVNRGKAERVIVSFSPRIAPYVRERIWHKSQKLQDLPDGGVRMMLNVSIDPALRTWILGFGGLAKVESPSALAEEILEQIETAREAYVPRLDLTISHRIFDHPRLPGLFPNRPA